jgi:hypothetical protein
MIGHGEDGNRMSGPHANVTRRLPVGIATFAGPEAPAMRGQREHEKHGAFDSGLRGRGVVPGGCGYCRL